MAYLKPGSVFFITGGARGIGAALARCVVAHGHRAVIADLDGNEAVWLADEIGGCAYGLALDVTREDQWNSALTEAVARFACVDVIVNNAGRLHAAFLKEQRYADICGMIDTNFHGVVNGFQAGLRLFEQQGYGHFVTIGSVAAFVPTPGQAVYSASKHGVRALHHAFAMECRGHPIHFSIVHPSTADTRLLDKQLETDAAALSFAQAPLTPDRIAKIIYRTTISRRREVIIPGFQGAFSRVLGVFPGVLSRVLAQAWKQGAKTQARERAKRCKPE